MKAQLIPSSSILEKHIHQPRKTKSLYNWLSNVTGVDAVWIEGIDDQDKPIWALAKRLSRTCWYVLSRKLKATAGIAALGGALLLPTGSLYAQRAIDFNELTGTNGVTIDGMESFNQHRFRFSVASGDINGDGFDDVIIGRSQDPDIWSHGKVHVVFGGPNSAASTINVSSLDGTTGFTVIGDTRSELGNAVATGDVNGDGIDDVIMAAYSARVDGASGGNPNLTGKVHVLFGKSTGFSSTMDSTSLDGSTGFSIHGTVGIRQFGNAVASGDLNGDGKDDVIIADDHKPFGHPTGKINVVFGFDDTSISTMAADPLTGSDGFIINGSRETYGYSIHAVATGDINGDGIDDLIVGAYATFGDRSNAHNDYFAGFYSGETYVVFGKSTTAFADTLELSSLDGSTGFTVHGSERNDLSGFSVASGDINGDGKDDVIIGIPGGEVGHDRRLYRGEASVIFGFNDTATDTVELSSLDGSTGFTFTGNPHPSAHMGKAVASGDINGDGIDDLITGAYKAHGISNLDAGETYVVFGKSTPFDPTVTVGSLDGGSIGFAINGIDANDRNGYALASGDFNGDGKDDLISKDETQDAFGQYKEKRVYVFTQFPVGAKLEGDEGLRMLAAPASGTILDEFLEPFWTQGMTGADTPNGDSNLWLWDETAGAEGNWIAVTDLSGQHVDRGEGFLMWVYADNNFDGHPEGFPKVLSTIDILNSAVADTGTVTPVNNLGDGRFFLVGNPYPSTFDWDSTSVTKTNLSNAIYIYDDASGKYQTWSGAIGNITDGRIEPLQSFFIQAFDETGTGGTGKLVIGEAARTDSSGTFFKQLPSREPRILAIKAEAGDKEAEAWLSFQEGGQLDRDIYDALYLQPFATEFLKLGTVLASEEILQINALPIDLAEELVIPLDLSGTVEATHATLSVSGLEAFEGWEFALRDTHTGEDFIIDSETSLELEIESIKAKLIQPQLPTPIPMKAKAAGTRYQMVVTPAPPVHNEPDPGIPSTIELQQNYPNPFNPRTIIEFGVPKQGEVRLEVFDILGRKVAELVNGPMQPGRYRVNFDASALSSGMYIYRLQTGNRTLTQKMTLIK